MSDETQAPPEEPQHEVPEEIQEQRSASDEFRQEQLAQARAQNIQGDNAVPEQRPQAFLQGDPSPSSLTQRLDEEGHLPSEEPHGQEAYDRASSDKQAKKAAKASFAPAPTVGSVIKFTDGPHRGRVAAVNRVVSYASHEDRLRAMSGEPSLREYTEPAEVEVAFRGDDRDGERAIVNLGEHDYELVPAGFGGRAFVTGAL